MTPASGESVSAVRDAIAFVDTGIHLRFDPARVIARLFVPGREDVGPGDSRATPVVDRVLALDDAETAATMADIDERFDHRHRQLHDVFRRHASLVDARIDDKVEISDVRRLLLGATFTHEYAIEGAALCNPSAVPVGPVRADGSQPFVMSVRGIGEGHRSSIGFRSGSVTARGIVTIDDPVPFAVAGRWSDGHNDRSVFHAGLAALGDDHENAAFVLDALPDRFTDAELERHLVGLAADGVTRRNTTTTIEHLRAMARSSYDVSFDADTDVSERVLWPSAPAESHGMEDARFVRFVDDDGHTRYLATYTAFDGEHIAQHLLTTDDFVTFQASPIVGLAAVGKGLALFPRKVGGRYAALSRHDRETNAIAFSDHLGVWPTADVLQVPSRPWELLQLGNCGPPIETEAGWLVLTHGVGAMRTYAIGAVLLDLDEPDRLIGWLDTPLLTPGHSQRDGYVPNVVYSCGGFVHGDHLVLPYGIADQTISVVTFSVAELLDAMVPPTT